MTASGRWCGWSGQVGRRVGVCVCVYVCMYVRSCLVWSELVWSVCLYVYLQGCVHVCVCICWYVWVCGCADIRLCLGALL